MLDSRLTIQISDLRGPILILMPAVLRWRQLPEQSALFLQLEK